MLERAEPALPVCGVTPERGTTVDDALALVRGALTDLGLQVDEVVIGDRELPVTRYVAKDREGRVVSRSSGKGRGAQSRVSGLFELVEHLHLDWRLRPYARDEPALRSIETVAGQHQLARANLIQRLRVGLAGQPVFSARYDALDPAGEPVWFPVFLRDPGYPHRTAPDDPGGFRAYLHFCTGAGTAAGTAKAEALLHAVCELAEHDALSLALAEWYLGHRAPGAQTALRRVDPGTMTADTAEVFEHVRARVDGDLWLLDITADIGVPAYFAVAVHPDTELPDIGLGASLLPDYAAQRALAEVLQGTVVHRQDPRRSRTEARQALRRVAQWPWMRRAVRLDMTELASRLPVVVTPLRSSAADAHAIDAHDVGALLAGVLAAFRRHGVEVYFRHATPVDTSGVVVVDVLAPGLELLDMVRLGWPLPPTGRLAGLLSPSRGEAREGR